MGEHSTVTTIRILETSISRFFGLVYYVPMDTSNTSHGSFVRGCRTSTAHDVVESSYTTSNSLPYSRKQTPSKSILTSALCFRTRSLNLHGPWSKRWSIGGTHTVASYSRPTNTLSARKTPEVKKAHPKEPAARPCP